MLEKLKFIKFIIRLIVTVLVKYILSNNFKKV